MIITKKTCVAILIATLPIVNSFAGENSKPEPSKPVFFDFGTKTSQLAEGFTAVTPESAWSPESGFGWVDKPAVTAVEKADLTKVKVLQIPKKPGMPDSVEEFTLEEALFPSR